MKEIKPVTQVTTKTLKIECNKILFVWVAGTQLPHSRLATCLFSTLNAIAFIK